MTNETKTETLYNRNPRLLLNTVIYVHRIEVIRTKWYVLSITIIFDMSISFKK